MKKILILFSASLVLLSEGCKKGFLDVNGDPNKPTTSAIGPGLILPNALNSTVSRMDPGPTSTSGWMAYWAISGSYAVSASDFTTYKETPSFGNGFWINYYDNLEDYQTVQDDSRSTSFFRGIAKIMKAVDFQYLVDAFNNVPYTDALKATAAQKPKYDRGDSIYGKNLRDITAGMALIKADAGTPPDASSDIMFSGDKTLWLKFANSIKLRMLIRMSEMTSKPPYFNAELATVAADPNGFLTTDALVQPGYQNSPGKANPFWQIYFDINGNEVSSFGDYFRANQFSIDFLKNNNDPRLTRIYSTATGVPGSYKGSNLGKIGGLPGNQLSRFGPGILTGALGTIPVATAGASAPAVMMTAAESYFLQSEAALRGWIPGNAQTLYESGVSASFDYLGASDASTYYTQAGNANTTWAAASGFAGQLNLIIRQKWVAANSINSFETWSDWRRFEYEHPAGPLGDLPLSTSPNIDVPKIPYRFLYPTVEIATNNENVLLQGPINHQTSKIFWMR